jgi:flagellar motor switch protein FliN/FliY
MSSFLSQDDIDALLGAALGSGDLTSSPASSVNLGEIVDNIVKCYNKHLKSVANTNLNREVSVEIDFIDSVQASTISEKFGGEYLLAEVPFSGGAQGSMRVSASKKDFAVIADLIVMGDGTTPYSNDCKDAVSELFSQISGAFATELGGKLGNPVSAAATAILDNTGVEAFEGDYSAFCTIKISDIAQPIIMIISPDETLVEKLSSSFGGKAPEPLVAAPAPAAPIPVMSQPSFGSSGVPDNSFSSKVPKINVDMLLDIELEVAIELGKTNIAIKNVLDLAPGSLVELDRLAGEPVDLLVNNKVVAKGEVIVIDENFGVRIISLVSPEERIRSLR